MTRLTTENPDLTQTIRSYELEEKIEMVDKRHLLENVISSIPGIRYNDLSRLTKLNNGTLSHHLSTLEKNYIIRVVRSENSNITRYYPISVPEGETLTQGYLKIKTTSKILRLIHANQIITFSDIVAHIGKAPSTTSWNLKRLCDANIVARQKRNYRTVYTLKNTKLLEKLMEKTNSALLDRSVDNFTSIMDSL